MPKKALAFEKYFKVRIGVRVEKTFSIYSNASSRLLFHEEDPKFRYFAMFNLDGNSFGIPPDFQAVMRLDSFFSLEKHGGNLTSELVDQLRSEANPP